MIILLFCAFVYLFIGGFLAEFAEATGKEVTPFAFFWPILFVVAAGQACYEMIFKR